MEIAPKPTTTSSDAVVTYQVTLEVIKNSDNPNLLLGMTANAIIETSRLENVLVVPNQAIQIETVDRQPIMVVELLDYSRRSIFRVARWSVHASYR